MELIDLSIYFTNLQRVFGEIRQQLGADLPLDAMVDVDPDNLLPTPCSHMSGNRYTPSVLAGLFVLLARLYDRKDTP